MQRTEGLRYNPNIQAPTFARMLREQTKWILPAAVCFGFSAAFLSLSTIAGVETQLSTLVLGQSLGTLGIAALAVWPLSASWRYMRNK